MSHTSSDASARHCCIWKIRTQDNGIHTVSQGRSINLGSSLSVSRLPSLHKPVFPILVFSLSPKHTRTLGLQDSNTCGHHFQQHSGSWADKNRLLLLLCLLLQLPLLQRPLLLVQLQHWGMLTAHHFHPVSGQQTHLLKLQMLELK